MQTPSRSHRDWAREGWAAKPLLYVGTTTHVCRSEMVFKIPLPQNKIHFIHICLPGSTVICNFFFSVSSALQKGHKPKIQVTNNMPFIDGASSCQLNSAATITGYCSQKRGVRANLQSWLRERVSSKGGELMAAPLHPSLCIGMIHHCRMKLQLVSSSSPEKVAVWGAWIWKERRKREEKQWLFASSDLLVYPCHSMFSLSDIWCLIPHIFHIESPFTLKGSASGKCRAGGAPAADMAHAVLLVNRDGVHLHLSFAKDTDTQEPRLLLSSYSLKIFKD